MKIVDFSSVMFADNKAAADRLVSRPKRNPLFMLRPGWPCLASDRFSVRVGPREPDGDDRATRLTRILIFM